jgi:hypothetical protein
MKNENGDPFMSPHNFVYRMRNEFSKLKIHAADEFREPEVHTAELLVPDHSFNETAIPIEKLKHYKPTRTD